MFLVKTGIWPSPEKKSPRPTSFSLTTLESNVTCSGAEETSVAFSIIRATVMVPCWLVSTCGGRKRTAALPTVAGAAVAGGAVACGAVAGGAVAGGAVAGGAVAGGALFGGAVAGGRPAL